MSIPQLVVGPNSSASLIRSDSDFTVNEITANEIAVDVINITESISTQTINVSSAYRINNIDVLTENTLESGITQSSLQTLGTLTELTVGGDSTFNGQSLFDNDVVINGDLQVNGTVTETNSVQATVTENFIKLANDNISDVADTGIYNLYNNGVTRFAGYARDASDNGRFKFFQNTTEQPTTTVNFNNPSLEYADVLFRDVEAESINITDGNITTLLTDAIGVANPSPVFPIDVVGDVNVDSAYRVDGTIVLTDTTLGSGIVNSSLETVGSLISLDVIGDTTIGTDSLNVDTSTNRVAINKSVPTSFLDVSGDINSDDVYKINGVEILSENKLADSVTESNIQTIGTLSSLTVGGDVNLADTLYVDSSAEQVGIGVAIPTTKLDVVETNALSDFQMKLTNNDLGGGAGIQMDNNLSTFDIIHTGGNANFNINNTNILSIQGDTNVGINTATANYDLDVGGDINADTGYKLADNDVITTNGITVPNQLINFDQNNSIDVDTNVMTFKTSNTEQIIIDGDGNVSMLNGNLGVSTPAEDLTLSLGESGNGMNYTDTNTLALYTGATERVVVNANGFMGVNVTSPQFRVDVAGSINFTGQLFQNGAPYVDSDGIWSQIDGTNAYNTLLGDIGIGITTPTAKLHVYEDNEAVALIESGGSQEAQVVYQTINGEARIGPTVGEFEIYTSANQPIAFSTNNVERFQMTNNFVAQNSGYIEGKQRICQIDGTGLNGVGNQPIASGVLTVVPLRYVITTVGPPPIHQKVFEFNNGYPNPAQVSSSNIENYVTVPANGLYRLTTRTQFQANGTGDRESQYFINQSQALHLVRVQAASGGSTTAFMNVAYTNLSAGDNVGIRVRQTSGGNLNLVDSLLTIEYVSQTI